MTDDQCARDEERAGRLASAAAAAVAHLVKSRARLYARRPMALEPLYPGLGSASTTTLVAVASYLAEREARSPNRWFGFGGEVNLINAKAALLLGRALRRAEGAMRVRDASR